MVLKTMKAVALVGPSTVCREPEGVCGPNACDNLRCQVGQWCDPAVGRCAEDPCNGVVCAAGQVCSGGSCYLPSDLGGENQYVAPGGGGCSAARGGSGLAIGLLALMFGLGGARRRRRRAAAPGGAR